MIGTYGYSSLISGHVPSPRFLGSQRTRRNERSSPWNTRDALLASSRVCKQGDANSDVCPRSHSPFGRRKVRSGRSVALAHHEKYDVIESMSFSRLTSTMSRTNFLKICRCVDTVSHVMIGMQHSKMWRCGGSTWYAQTGQGAKRGIPRRAPGFQGKPSI